MTTPVPDTTLDAILAMQVTVARAGEGRCSPRRLGWWDTDLIDDAGGGDFLKRLLPQTHAWASLEAVREAARRTDAKARGKMAEPDKMRSVYFLGSRWTSSSGTVWPPTSVPVVRRPKPFRCPCRSPPTSRRSRS